MAFGGTDSVAFGGRDIIRGVWPLVGGLWWEGHYNRSVAFGGTDIIRGVWPLVGGTL